MQIRSCCQYNTFALFSLDYFKTIIYTQDILLGYFQLNVVAKRNEPKL